MTHPSRACRICSLTFALVLLAASAAWTQNCPPATEKVAKAFGIDSFGQIDAIRYTFTLPQFKVNHSWTWEPKADRVTFEGTDKDGKPVKVTYVRSQLSSQPESVQKQIDPAFINDQYWLVFPVHTCWDKGADVQDKGMEKLPIGKGTARHVVVKYQGGAGYTPGDTWELFVGPDNRVQQFVYRRGNTAGPKLVIATWTGYKMAGPLLVATDHQGTADGNKFSVTFSNVAVKLAGSDNWIDAK